MLWSLFKKVEGTKAWNFVKKDTLLAQVFSCEFCENFKNTLAASDTSMSFICKKEII